MYILIKKYMYIHIYIYYVHMHIYRNTYTCIGIHVHTVYTHTYMRIYMCILNICTHTDVYKDICTCLYMYAYMCIYIYVYRCGCVRLIRFPCPRDPTYSFKWKLGHTSRSCSSVTYTHNYGIRMYMWFPYVHVLSKRRFVAERETVRPPERSARVITWTREKLF